MFFYYENSYSMLFGDLHVMQAFTDSRMVPKYAVIKIELFSFNLH